MARGHLYPPETKAAAVRLYLEGKTFAQIGRQLQVPPRTVKDWAVAHDPARAQETQQLYQRTKEELSDLVYGTVVDTLKSIRARAVATAEPEWIRSQTAADLAELDATHWGFIVRFVGAFRPTDDSASDPALSEPEPDRNGTVDAPE